MSEHKNTGLAVALAGGYVLGRAGKGRMALTAAALLLGRGLNPRDAVTGGIRRIPGVPNPPDAEESAPDESGSEDGGHQGVVTRKARSVAAAAANRGLSALTDALHERTLGLDGGGAPADDETEEADDAEAAEDDDESPEPAARPRKPTQAAKKTAKKAAAGKPPAARKGPAKKAPPAGRAAAKKSRAAEKTASRPRRDR